MTSIKDSLRRGAEAILIISKWHGRVVIIKERVTKGYRHPILDAKLRMERLRTETRLFQEARKHGITVPVIYDIDQEKNWIIMEYIKGKQVKDIINNIRMSSSDKKKICNNIGQLIGKLHNCDIVHGDLTTSNIIWASNKLYLIDFSMGAKNANIERKGVDFHLLKESFQSAHSKNIELLKNIEYAYLKEYPEGKKVIKKMYEIEERGRYSRNVK